jgi:hypothetical protein
MIRKGVTIMCKRLCMVLVCMNMICSLSINAEAIDSPIVTEEQVTAAVDSSTRASGSFNMEIKAYGKGTGETVLPMEAGETVRIYATYSPDSASVDFGIIDPDGIFHYINVTDGSIDKTILIEERGNYTLAIRNNSGQDIQVSGFVKY